MVVLELAAIAYQIAQLTDCARGDKTRTQEPILQQLRQPGRVTDVGLATRHPLDIRRIDQQQREALLQYVKHRFPVDPGRLHRNMAHALRAQPVMRTQQLIAGPAEAANLLGELAAWAVDPHTCGQRGLVHVNPAAAPIDSLHGRPPLRRCAGAYSHKEILLCVLKATMRGTTVCPAVKLINGLPGTTADNDLDRTGAASPYPIFIQRGWVADP